MPQLPDKVNPGDLITAGFINSLLDKLSDLDTRVGNLEGTGAGQAGLTITKLVPSAPWRVSQEIQIQGRNFGFSVGSQRVYFDNTRVDTFKPGSSDTNLVVDVPSIPNLPDSGKDVTVLVTNQQVSDSRIVRVLPVVIPLQGNVDVNWESVDPNPILANQKATIQYRLVSRASVPATFALSAVISPASWQGNVHIRNLDGTEITDRQITLANGEQRVIQVTIEPVPTGTTGTVLNLTVTATAGSVSGTDSRSFTVGTAAESPDPSITVSYSAFTSLDASASFSNNTVHLKQGVVGTVVLNAEFTVVGKYDITPSLVSPTANWFTVLTETPTPLEIRQSDLDAGGGKATETLQFNVRPDAAATSPGQIELKVKRQGGTGSSVTRFGLEVSQ